MGTCLEFGTAGTGTRQSHTVVDVIPRPAPTPPYQEATLLNTVYRAYDPLETLKA
jgi:hypothetical protein